MIRAPLEVDPEITYSLPAETAILGAILLDNDDWPQAAAKISAEDFSLLANGCIFTRMGEPSAAEEAHA